MKILELVAMFLVTFINEGDAEFNMQFLMK